MHEEKDIQRQSLPLFRGKGRENGREEEFLSKRKKVILLLLWQR